jgi:hypothetical protein
LLDKTDIEQVLKSETARAPFQVNFSCISDWLFFAGKNICSNNVFCFSNSYNSNFVPRTSTFTWRWRSIGVYRNRR